MLDHVKNVRLWVVHLVFVLMLRFFIGFRVGERDIHRVASPIDVIGLDQDSLFIHDLMEAVLGEVVSDFLEFGD